MLTGTAAELADWRSETIKDEDSARKRPARRGSGGSASPALSALARWPLRWPASRRARFDDDALRQSRCLHQGRSAAGRLQIRAEAPERLPSDAVTITQQGQQDVLGPDEPVPGADGLTQRVPGPSGNWRERDVPGRRSRASVGPGQHFLRAGSGSIVSRSSVPRALPSPSRHAANMS